MFAKACMSTLAAGGLVASRPAGRCAWSTQCSYSKRPEGAGTSAAISAERPDTSRRARAARLRRTLADAVLTGTCYRVRR
jgi:hypothetical protein